MITVDQLSVRMGGRDVIDSVSLTVEAGQTVIVTGANGAGKSVLARAVAGVAPASGKVTLGGLGITRVKARRQLGYLPQNCGLYDYLSVSENLRFFAALARVSWRSRRKVVSDLLDLVGLGGVAEVEVSRLTPGQRQRLAIARTLAGDPKVLVLDEPLAGLDTAGRAEMAQLLGELAEMAKAILITTGDPLSLKCDRQFELVAGRLRGEAQ